MASYASGTLRPSIGSAHPSLMISTIFDGKNHIEWVYRYRKVALLQFSPHPTPLLPDFCERRHGQALPANLARTVRAVDHSATLSRSRTMRQRRMRLERILQEWQML